MGDSPDVQNSKQPSVDRTISLPESSWSNIIKYPYNAARTYISGLMDLRIWDLVVGEEDYKTVPEDPSPTPIDREVERLLEEWKVDLYSKNVYLHYIPQERVNEKRLELYDMVSKRGDKSV